MTFLPELVRPIRPLTDWEALERIGETLRRLCPDIVHTHSSKAGILGRWAARRAGVPIILHTVHGFAFHDHMAAGKRAIFRTLERSTARITDQFICVARADIDKGVRAGIFSPDEVSLIRSGIPLEPFRQAAGRGAAVRRQLGIPDEAPLAGMISCLKPQKDPLTFVRMAARVQARIAGAHFMLVGDGELRSEVERAAAEAGLSGRLHVTGWRRDIPDIVDALDVLVLTSLHEGLPRVVPEAMAGGRPVVATAVDGTPEAVRDGETGFLVAPRDVATLVERVVPLLQDRPRARRMGAAAAGLVEEFDIDTMVRRQESLYARLAASQEERAA